MLIIEINNFINHQNSILLNVQLLKLTLSFQLFKSLSNQFFYIF